MAPPELSAAPDTDSRVLELAKEYEAEWERGHRPDRARYLDRAAALGPELAECLDGIDLLYGAVPGARPHAPAGRALERGDRLGEFEIVREIGRGGMGIVYEATQPALGRRVAIKVLPRELATDRSRLRRFAVEVRAAASVAHPHIVPVYAVGADRGVNYYAMRLVDGLPLDALIARTRRPTAPSDAPRGEPLSVPDALVRQSARDRAAHHRAAARLGATVARALDHAHQNGVVHRDVKPANLLLGRDGHVWVTDFGLAQFAAGGAATQTGTALGTLRYMSPEQASGDRRRLDHRTDVYSLAATLYELATGRPVFPSEDPATVLRQIARDAPPAPRSIDRTLPADLEAVLLKGLEKDPRDRYATAAEFADDLERFAAGRTVRARRPRALERARRWTGRHPAFVTAALVVLVLAVAVSALVAVLARRAYRAERDRADEAERRFNHSKRLGDLMVRISEEEVGANAPPLFGTRRRLLVAALENYRELLEAEPSDDAMRAELGRVRARIEALLADEEAGRESWRVRWLCFAPVRAELGLTPEQDARVRRALNRDGADGPGAPHEREELFRTLIDAGARRAVLRVLSADQRKRLGELHLQLMGPRALNEPEVVDALALTPDQRLKVRELLPLGPPKLNPPFELPFEGLVNGVDPARATARVMECLTPQQHEAWRALVGRPFKMH